MHLIGIIYQNITTMHGPMNIKCEVPVWRNKTNKMGVDVWRVWERREVPAGFWLGNLSLRYHLDVLDLDGRISIKTDLKK